MVGAVRFKLVNSIEGLHPKTRDLLINSRLFILYRRREDEESGEEKTDFVYEQSGKIPSRARELRNSPDAAPSSFLRGRNFKLGASRG
jgi:hypothetical protein